MPSKTIIDKKGRKYEWSEFNGHGYFDVATKIIIPAGWEAQMKQIKMMEIRDDDVLVCTFPKAGTHWIWEIVSMVTSGKAEYETRPTESLILEFQSSESIASAPSPRVLCTHFAASCLPEQIVSKNTKIIHVMRHPKDVVTSYYHHFKRLGAMLPVGDAIETFSDFLPYITGEYGVYMFVSMWRYLKEMDKFAKEHPGLVLTLRFEDMKENLTDAVRKVAEFLKKDLSSAVIEQIAENCSFEKLKAANASVKKRSESIAMRMDKESPKAKKPMTPPDMYRKGIVGDWKNEFTVAESERFDQVIEDQLKDCDFKFT